MTGEVITYEPDNCLKHGYFRVLPEILRELWANRWLSYQIFRRDFTAGFKQSFGGFAYLILGPLVSTGMFLLLNQSGVFNLGEIDVPYPIFSVSGSALWGLFSGAVTAGPGALLGAGAMLTKIRFSRKALVIASVANVIVHFMIQFGLVLVLFAVFRVVPSPGILLIPFAAIPLLILGMGLGYALAVFNAIVRDVGTLIGQALYLLMMITPVMYAKPKEGFLGEATVYNPVYYLVSVPRDLALTGKVHDGGIYFACAAGTIFVFLFGLVVFHMTESRIAERI